MHRLLFVDVVYNNGSSCGTVNLTLSISDAPGALLAAYTDATGAAARKLLVFAPSQRPAAPQVRNTTRVFGHSAPLHG